ELATVLDAASLLDARLGAPAGAGSPPPQPHAAEAPIAGPPDSIQIPLLAEGADPAGDPVPSAIETLALDRALLPPLPAGATLVGSRLGAHGVRRIPQLSAGDCAIVLLGADPPGPDAPCAVRIGGRVEIARVRIRDGHAHLPPSSDAADSDATGVS